MNKLIPMTVLGGGVVLAGVAVSGTVAEACGGPCPPRTTTTTTQQPTTTTTKAPTTTTTGPTTTVTVTVPGVELIPPIVIERPATTPRFTG